MALVTQPADGLWAAQLKNTQRQGRSLLASLFENSDAATPQNGTRSGVIVTTGLATALDLQCGGVAGLTVQVSPGSGVAHLAGQGPQLGWLNATKTVTCADAPASNPRNDIIVMRMYNLTGGDTSPDGQPCRIEVVTGTPNAVPVDPVTPNANGVITTGMNLAGLGTGGVAIPLGRAQVSTGGVITLTDIRRSAGVVGGPRYVLPGDGAEVLGRAGQLRYTPGTNLLEMKRTDGNWYSFPQGVIARGFVTTSSTAGNPSPAMRIDNVPLLANHMYRVYTSNVNLFGTANDTVSMEIWWSNIGAATTGSLRLPGARSEIKLVNGGGAAGQAHCDTVYVSPVNQTASFLVAGERNTGIGNVTVFADATSILALTVEDLGIAPANTAVDL